MTTTTFTTTRLTTPSLPHKLLDARHLYGTAPLIALCVGFLFVLILYGGSVPVLLSKWFAAFGSVFATFLFLNIFFIKTLPKDHALVNSEGKILTDFERGNYALWRWEYTDLLKQGSLVGYQFRVDTIKVSCDRRRYEIVFLANASLEAARALETILASLQEARIRNAEGIVLCNFYDVLSEHPDIVNGLTNPLRIEQQEAFHKMLIDHLLPKLSGTGIKVVAKMATFSWS